MSAGGDRPTEVDPDGPGPTRAPRIGHRVVALEETGSTMDDARRELERVGPAAAHGVLVHARLQRAGRGTRGRPWVTAPDATLPLSFVVTPRTPLARPALLTLAAALAVTDAADALGAALRVRWPNDVVDDAGRKVAGVLAEAVGSRPPAYLVGVGWNVLPSGIEPKTLDDVPGSLLEAGGRVADRLDALPPFAAAMEERWRALAAGRVDALRRDFEARSSLARRWTRFRRGRDEITARLRGLTPELDLRLETQGGGEVIWPAEQVERVRAGGGPADPIP